MRLFVAIPLPETLRQRLAAICAGVPGARWSQPENMHVTLRFIGEVAGPDMPALMGGLSRVRADPFALAVRGVGQFGDRRRARLLWAGIEGGEALALLQRRVEQAVMRCGFEREARKFHPHVTLARLQEAPLARVRDFLVDNARFDGGVVLVEEFVLFSSHLGSRQASYREEAAFPLTAAQQTTT